MHGLSAGSVRPFERRDIPDVCLLFLRTFRSGKGRPSDELAKSIEATYLTSPAYSAERGSIVHVNAHGAVDGFMGVINTTLKAGERLLRGAVLSAYMADRPDVNPNIGVRLVRAILARPLDVVFSDTANRRSLEISQALRFTIVPLQSLEWIKVLRPVGTGGYLLRKRQQRAAKWLGSAMGAIDALIPRYGTTRTNAGCIEGSVDRPIPVADFVAEAPKFLGSYALRPAWDEAELTWLIGQASLQTRNGPLHIREVIDRTGRRAGLYLLYARERGTAVALQVLARQGRDDVVVGNILQQAGRLGAVSVRGVASREAVQGLLRQPGIFYHQVMSMVVWAAEPEVAALVRSGNIFLGGLAGETWARIFADTFS